MSLNGTICETNKCVSCNCSCNKSGGHSCEECSVCTPEDDHTRKEE